MLESTFLHTFRQAGAARITENHILFRKPLQIYNMHSDETVYFKSNEEMYRYRIETGETVGEIIKNAKPREFWEHTLNGGRGSDSDSWSGGFDHAEGPGESKTTKDFPARMNGIIKAKNEKEALNQFRTKHVGSGREHGVTVDENGFVTSYVHGGETSVAIYGRKGEMVLHNHPGNSKGRGGNFSDADLISTATGQESGIVAVAPEGNYIFRKGQHFKPDRFAKAVKNATIRGKNYDDAAGKWLTRNQKKYGYTYSFEKA